MWKATNYHHGNIKIVLEFFPFLSAIFCDVLGPTHLINVLHALTCALPNQHCVGSVCMHLQWARQKFRSLQGTVRHQNQSWTNIICSGRNQSWTNPEPIILIRSATVQLWSTSVRTHPFTFWFSRSDPELKGFFPLVVERGWVYWRPPLTNMQHFLNNIELLHMEAWTHNIVSTNNKIRNIHINHM